MAKRKPDKQLTHDNWDEEDTPEEIGAFQKASNDTLKKRVIKQARRRISSTSSNPEPKSIFAGFTGFTKQPESKKFSFNSNLAAASHSSANVSNQPYKFSFAATTTSNTNASSTVRNVNSNFSVNEKQNAVKTTNSSIPSTLPDKTSEKETANVSKLNELSESLLKTDSPTKAKNDDQKTPDDIFLQKLRSLNLLCAEWIIKHLNENLGYILTPIFDDYQKYLNKLKEERRLSNSSSKKTKIDTPVSSGKSSGEPFKSLGSFKVPDFKSSILKFSSTSNLSSEVKTNFTLPVSQTNGPSSFQFLTNAVTSKNDSNESKGDGTYFKFTAQPSGVNASENMSKFSFNPTTTISNPFVGINNTAPSTAITATDEVDTKTDQDEAPPVVNETITEDGAIYEKKCKVFVKKDGSFVDHGIGFLFLKLVGDDKKCQLIVRANNKLATIILNVLLTANIPVQLMGTNNVMLICCPTPEAKPSSVLLKVKTADDAKELFDTLNHHKK